MGWVALDEEAFNIQTADDKVFEGTPLITVDIGFEGIPETFMSDSTLMVV
jgi:hypothetical protein